jgi:hypothetical protein
VSKPAELRALLIAEQTTDTAAAGHLRIVPLADYGQRPVRRELHRHRRFIDHAPDS